MMNNSDRVDKSNSYKRRRTQGSQIAELPPALMIIFFLFFFPVLNLLYLAMAFGIGWYLNSIELREVARHEATTLGLAFPPDQAYHTVSNLPESQKWNGLMGVTEVSPPSPEVAQFPLSGNPNSIGTSKVRTTVSIRPFFAMKNGPNTPKWPILSEIPGLGKPITFVYNGTIQQEEQGP